MKPEFRNNFDDFKNDICKDIESGVRCRLEVKPTPLLDPSTNISSGCLGITEERKHTILTNDDEPFEDIKTALKVHSPCNKINEDIKTKKGCKCIKKDLNSLNDDSLSDNEDKNFINKTRNLITEGNKSKISQLNSSHNKNPPQFGNYPHYYGYRHTCSDLDPRISLMERSWLYGKEVLDVGCNAGKVTLDVARAFHPKRIVGVDIDRCLIANAKKNLKQYKQRYLRKERRTNVCCRAAKRFKRTGLKPNSHCGFDDVNVSGGGDSGGDRYGGGSGVCGGGVGCGGGDKPAVVECSEDGGHDDDIHPSRNASVEALGKNIFFIQTNYVPDSQTSLATIMPEFDTILALSVTKWIHLNTGDEGLKMAFHKMHLQLRSGGLLLLEPQDWSSYRRKKIQTIKSCKDLEFKPDDFVEFLIHEVGFKSHQYLGTSQHSSKGFQRRMILFRK